MSILRKAVQAAADRWWWGQDKAISAAAQVDLMSECLSEALAALPPSIVVDGKVVELEKAVRLNVFTDRDEVQPEDDDGFVQYVVDGLLDAAREVADAPSS